MADLAVFVKKFQLKNKKIQANNLKIDVSWLSRSIMIFKRSIALQNSTSDMKTNCEN